MCIAEFAANCITRNRQEHPEDKISDVLPTPEDGASGRCESIKLKSINGCLYKHNREAIIHLHQFNFEKEPGKVYRSKTMLCIPWRDEHSDLMDGYIDFHSDYEGKLDDVLEKWTKVYWKCY